jgi:hypothetical protein
MLFDPKVAAVFQEYQARHEQEQESVKLHSHGWEMCIANLETFVEGLS